MEFILYSDKALSVILPEKPRQIYSGCGRVETPLVL